MADVGVPFAVHILITWQMLESPSPCTTLAESCAVYDTLLEALLYMCYYSIKAEARPVVGSILFCSV